MAVGDRRRRGLGLRGRGTQPMVIEYYAPDKARLTNAVASLCHAGFEILAMWESEDESLRACVLRPIRIRLPRGWEEC